jgi:hypothetical protein
MNAVGARPRPDRQHGSRVSPGFSSFIAWPDAHRRLKRFLRLVLSGYLQTPTTQVVSSFRFILTVRRGEVYQ